MIERDVFEHVDDAIFCLDRNWRVVDLNSAAQAFYGLEHDAIVGRVIWDRAQFRENEQLRLTLLAVMESRRPSHIDLFLESQGRWADARIFPLAEDGLGFSLRDISDLKRREVELTEAVENQETWFRELTHGVMNTLQEAASRVRLEGRNMTDPAARERCSRLSDVIHGRSLVYSRLCTGADSYTQNLDEYVPMLCEYLAAGLPDNVRLSTVAKSGAYAPVDAATTVGMILAELIVNSGKHAWPSGRPGHIQITLRRVDSEIEIELSDDGRGLPDEPELHASHGLGLKLIQAHAKRLRGQFTRMKTEKGAGFLLRLPAGGRYGEAGFGDE